MTQKFDEGNILVQKRLPIESGISAFKLFSSLADLGNQALSEAVDMAISGDPGRPQDLSKKSYFSHPTTESYRELRSNGFRIMRLREMWETIRKEVRNA
jgi:methionyl-tRNA formyltransferase